MEEMSLEEAKKILKNFQDSLILTFKDDEEINEAIDTVLNELENSIPRKDIEERLNKLKNKQKELDEEGFYGRYKKYGGKQKFEKYYAYINGTIQAYEELLNKE